MNETHVKTHEKDREEKTKFSEILPNNQIITACCIELQVQEMTMKKLTMIGLIFGAYIVLNIPYFSHIQIDFKDTHREKKP